MARNRNLPRQHRNLPTADEAEMLLELWMTRKFSTWDIARFLRLHESVVERTIHAARDLARMLVEQERGAG